MAATTAETPFSGKSAAEALRASATTEFRKDNVKAQQDTPKKDNNQNNQPKPTATSSTTSHPSTQPNNPYAKKLGPQPAGKRAYVQRDTYGNEYLDENDWDSFPGLDADTRAVKKWNEDHGNWTICPGCRAFKEMCDHAVPCGRCKGRNCVCKRGQDAPKCNRGITCMDPHNYQMYLLEQNYEAPALWGWPADPKTLPGNGAKNSPGHKIPYKSMHQLPEPGIALKYNAESNPNGYAEEYSELRLYHEFFESWWPQSKKDACLAFWHNKGELDVVPAAAPQQPRQQHNQTETLLEVPAEYRAKYGNDIMLFKLENVNAYHAALAAHKNRYNTGEDPQNAAMPGDKKLAQPVTTKDWGGFADNAPDEYKRKIREAEQRKNEPSAPQ